MMLALPAPFGYPNGYWLRMHFDNNRPLQRKAFREILWSFSGYMAAADKIINCLIHSGQYECLVMHGVMQQATKVAEAFAPIGVVVTIESKGEAELRRETVVSRDYYNNTDYHLLRLNNWEQPR